MNLTGNTMLITGGGSGIGRGLAEAFHRLGNHVIVAGRRHAALERMADAHPGMRCAVLDMDSPQAIRGFAQDIAAEHPAMNVVINNAGIQRPENLRNPSEDLLDMEAMVTTNLLGPMRLTAALMPLLLRQQRSAIMNVTSALAFLPVAGVPTYCATKAAMHSYTLSLRHQLRHTSTEVIELIPPYVQTDLGPDHGTDPRAMPLEDFIVEAMAILRDHPDATEVVVDRSKPLRFAAEGDFDAVFKALNQAMG